MRILVEVSQGLGNCVQGAPLCHALWLMGHELDLFINADGASRIAELWRGWPVLGHVFTQRSEFRVRDYDFSVSAFGRRLLQRLFAPGLNLRVMSAAVKHQSETEANVELARFLGYAGPTPAAHVNKSERKFGLSPGAVTIHAGCAPHALHKRWPHWPLVCAKLKAEGRQVVVVGTSADKSAEGWENAFTTFFDLPLPDLAALLNEATAHIGNDSGVGHVAAAVGLPGLVLFGPTDPVKNAPNSRVLRALAPPQPGDIAQWSEADVWAAIKAVLAEPARDFARALPQRKQDSAELRWQHYIEATHAQAETPGVTESANLPDGFKPRVSVVIPTFNRSAAARRAVSSVLAQDVPGVEVLLVDDGSTDDTAQVFAKPPERVRYLRKPNGGASSARNVGLRRARGEWIALLDSDDEWLPGKLAAQLEGAKQARVSRYIHINPDDSREEKPDHLPAPADFAFVYRRFELKTSTLLFRRELIEKAGLFNERFPISNDWDFFLRVASAAGGIDTQPKPMAVIHRSDNSISRSNRYLALEHAFTRICMLNGLLLGSGKITRADMIERAGAKQLELSRAAHAQGGKHHMHKARHHAKEAIRAGFWLEGLLRLLRALV